MNNTTVGSLVSVLPAYEMKSKARTGNDGFAGLHGEVIAVEGDDFLVELSSCQEVWLHGDRLVAPCYFCDRPSCDERKNVSVCERCAVDCDAAAELDRRQAAEDRRGDDP